VYVLYFLKERTILHKIIFYALNYDDIVISGERITNAVHTVSETLLLTTICLSTEMLK